MPSRQRMSNLRFHVQATVKETLCKMCDVRLQKLMTSNTPYCLYGVMETSRDAAWRP